MNAVIEGPASEKNVKWFQAALDAAGADTTAGLKSQQEREEFLQTKIDEVRDKLDADHRQEHIRHKILPAPPCVACSLMGVHRGARDRRENHGSTT